MADVPAMSITVTNNSDGTTTFQVYSGQPLFPCNQMLIAQWLFSSTQWTAIKALSSSAGTFTINETTSDQQEGFSQVFNQI